VLLNPGEETAKQRLGSASQALVDHCKRKEISKSKE